MNKLVRCAVYTRKSSEEGLDQAFNSLHAQREACEAYVKSQASEGWKLLPALYDDGGFSGGNMARPALEKLLVDVDAGRIDTVVVYKVDRLTRSLPDFARIVDRLDAAGASFVSVTQAFNTTTSMGRLTLNVLLSFAQFEREVTGERIRDKIAASKARGMWMGGNLPLGYDAPIDPKTRALVVNPTEAEIVRYIFRTYLELGTAHGLEARLDAEGVRSKAWTTRAGKACGGSRLGRGPLFYILKNRVYLGEIPHRNTTYPGAHPAILDPALFDAAQVMLASHRRSWKERPMRSANMPLRGLLFDIDGSPMSPTFAYGKNDRVYRYYVSALLQTGRPVKQDPCALRRVAADEIQQVLEEHLKRRFGADDEAQLPSLLKGVKRIDVEADAIQICFIKAKVPRSAISDCEPHDVDPALAVATLLIRCKLRGGRTTISASGAGPAVMEVERDQTLIRGLKQGHRLAAAIGWRVNSMDMEEGCSVASPTSAYQRKLCRLAFLAPDIQTSILEGRQPADLTLQRLMNCSIPTSWSSQRSMFGISR
jgi:DNA invertase Pin-like site-specific DNA recombinase